MRGSSRAGGGGRLLVIGTGGCWGWRGRIGKTTDATGARVDETGPLPDMDRITWRDRDTIIVFDANAATNTKVQAARRALAAQLAKRGARVRLAPLPTVENVNGPDDLIAVSGDATLWQVIDGAHAADDPGDDRETSKRSQATVLVDLALEAGVELWHTPAGDPHITVDVAGHREHHPLAGRACRDWLARLYHTKTARTPGAPAITDALSTLSGMARYDGDEHVVHVRVAGRDRAVYLPHPDYLWRDPEELEDSDAA